MTMFTGWTGWLIFITACVATWLLAGAGIAAIYHQAKTAYQKRQRRLDQLIHDEQARIDQLIMNARCGAEAERLFPGTTGDKFGDRYDWQQFVQGHDWPVNCSQCIWWIPAPSEAEDCIAVYQPCPRHEKQHQERRVAE